MQAFMFIAQNIGTYCHHFIFTDDIICVRIKRQIYNIAQWCIEKIIVDEF